MILHVFIQIVNLWLTTLLSVMNTFICFEDFNIIRASDVGARQDPSNSVYM